MSTPYTHEERERAAGEVYDRIILAIGEYPLYASKDRIISAHNQSAITIQMQLNRLMERDREARDLIENSTRRKFGMKEPEYRARTKAWLSHKPEDV